MGPFLWRYHFCDGTISVGGSFLWRDHFCGRIISVARPFLWRFHFCVGTISVTAPFVCPDHFCAGTIISVTGSFLWRYHFCDGAISMAVPFLWWLHFCVGYTFVTGTFLSGYDLSGETISMAESFIHLQKQRYIKSNPQNFVPSKNYSFFQNYAETGQMIITLCFCFFNFLRLFFYFFQDSIFGYTPRFEKRYVRQYILSFFPADRKCLQWSYD